MNCFIHGSTMTHLGFNSARWLVLPLAIVYTVLGAQEAGRGSHSSKQITHVRQRLAWPARGGTGQAHLFRWAEELACDRAEDEFCGGRLGC